MNSPSKTLCSFPWRAAAIRPNGLTIPCCRYPHINEPDSFVSSPAVRNTDHWKNIRKKMLNGELVDGCHSCYQDESNGLLSMRQHSLKKFIPINEEIIPVEQLEISFSNLCNLACVHCSSFFSSKWYSEDVKANRILKSGVLENNFNFSTWDLSKVTELKIIGGEPFMEQEKFIDLLKQLNLKKINLQICTNGTILPNAELKLLIEQCNEVYFCVSLDGLNSTNDWYRWPSKFSKILDNIKIFENWWKNNSRIIFIIHHVINAINIHELSDFIEFMEKELSLWKIEWDWIRWPHWQELSALPNSIKIDLISKFDYLNSIYIDQNLRPNPYRVSIERLLENSNSNFSELKLEAIKISKERNLDFLEMVPAFKKFWNL